MEFVAFNDLDPKAASGQELVDGIEKFLTEVTGVGPDMTQPAEAQGHFFEEDSSAGLIRKVGSRNQHSEHESRGIHDHMPLASHNFLSSIKATDSGVISRFNTLRVDNRSGRSFFFPPF